MGYKKVHIFPLGFSSKVNVIMWLGFEFTCFKTAGQQFSHYATRTSSGKNEERGIMSIYLSRYTHAYVFLCKSLGNLRFELTYLFKEIKEQVRENSLFPDSDF